jgi:hypothetical protein
LSERVTIYKSTKGLLLKVKVCQNVFPKSCCESKSKGAIRAF